MKNRFKFFANKKETPKQVMVQCTSLVNKDAVRREIRNGVEHIIISSFTLPDDVVMNGGLYPAEEIAKSFASLERKLAPIEHPTDSNGKYISANDPLAISDFHGGAHNENVRQEGGRIHLDKVVNVVEANKTERGKRLLDRIKELETNDNPRPIHTSTSLSLDIEETDGVQTNAKGDEYTWIASNMTFDHDAILLDTVAAAQPHQGVGMAVNSKGDKVDVYHVNLDGDLLPIPGEDEMSHDEIESALNDTLRKPPFNGGLTRRVFPSTLIFWSDDQLFSAPYVIREKKAIIMGMPLAVELDETFKPKTNKQDDDAMKEVIVNALKAAGVEIENLDDAALLAKYNELQANESDDDGDEDKDIGAIVAAAVVNALKPVSEEIAGLKEQLNANDDSELDEYSKLIGNSDKYPGIDADSAKKMGLETLKGMVANCGDSYGIPLQTNAGQGDQGDQFKAPSTDSLPE